jgi:hypothetical protein
MLMLHVDHLYRIFYHIDHNEAKIILQNFIFKIDIKTLPFQVQDQVVVLLVYQSKYQRQL